MPWVPKPGVPAEFDLSQAFYALVRGEPAWDWVSKWTPLVGLVRRDTASFCAAGPPPDVAIPDLPKLGGPWNIVADALTATAIGGKISQLMGQRVFYAYCTSTDPGTGSATWYEVCRAAVAGGSPHTVLLDCPAPDSNGSNYRLHQVYTAGNGTWIHVDINLAGARVEDWGSGPVEGPMDYVRGMAGPFDQVSWYIDDRAGNSTVSGYIAVERYGVPPAGDVAPPPPPPPPPGGNPDLGPPPETLPDIGAELQRQEVKLDAALSLLRHLASRNLPVDTDPVTPAPKPGDPPAGGPAAQVETSDALGVVVDVDVIPPEAGMDFVTPPRYRRMGILLMQTADGWLPPVDITVSPMVVRPIPPGVTLARAETWPGGSVRVRLLMPQPAPPAPGT